MRNLSVSLYAINITPSTKRLQMLTEKKRKLVSGQKDRSQKDLEVNKSKWKILGGVRRIVALLETFQQKRSKL